MIISLLFFSQVALATDFKLENSESTYQIFDAAKKPQGFYHYKFLNQVGDGIESLVTIEKLDGSKSSLIYRVNVGDYITAHHAAVEDMKICTEKITYRISNNTIVGCKSVGQNGFTVSSPDVPMTVVESILVSDNFSSQLIDFVGGN